jgi:hypothetical protein
MTYPNFNSLNNTLVDAAHTILGDPASDVSQPSTGDYVVGNAGGSVADNWNGTYPGSPQPTDIVSFNLTVADASRNVIQYTFTQANGAISSAIGAEIIGYNSTGILAEQITGYVSGQTTLSLNPDYFLVFSLTDLNTLEAGYSGPPASALQFGQSGAFPTLPPVCFGAGTRIACPTGEVAVEDLRPGDLVLLSGGGSSKIVWVGTRHIECCGEAAPETVWPIRVSPGAFSEGQPYWPLMLSPEHAVFIDGALIPIRLLANGTSIRQVECDSIDYFHIELEHHAIIFAEGLPAESYLDVGNRSWFDNDSGRGPRSLERPEFAWEGKACAPLIQTGPVVAAARDLLAARAAELRVPVDALS